MTFKESYYWHTNNRFVKEDAAEILQTIARSDNHLARNISFRAQNNLKISDESMTFFIELLQRIYQSREKWKNNKSAQATVAMVNASLNFFLLARHAVILGYENEAQMIFRGCFERMTRAVVFQVDNNFTDRFWKGEQINQYEVNDRISRYLESKNENAVYKKILESYKKNWSLLSRLSHPNVEVIVSRTLTQEGRLSSDNFGVDVSIGGTSNEFIISGITSLLIHVTFSLSLLRILISEFLGKWDKKLEKKYSRLTEKGIDVPLTELERQIDLLERYRPRFT